MDAFLSHPRLAASIGSIQLSSNDFTTALNLNFQELGIDTKENDATRDKEPTTLRSVIEESVGQSIDQVAGTITSALAIVDELLLSQAKLAHNTNEIHKESHKLIQSERKLKATVRRVGGPLSYYESLFVIGKRFGVTFDASEIDAVSDALEIMREFEEPITAENTPSIGSGKQKNGNTGYSPHLVHEIGGLLTPCDPEFKLALDRMDECIQWLSQHPGYKASLPFLARYRELQRKAYMLVKDEIIRLFNKTVAQAKLALEKDEQQRTAYAAAALEQQSLSLQAVPASASHPVQGSAVSASGPTTPTAGSPINSTTTAVPAYTLSRPQALNTITPASPAAVPTRELPPAPPSFESVEYSVFHVLFRTSLVELPTLLQHLARQKDKRDVKEILQSIQKEYTLKRAEILVPFLQAKLLKVVETALSDIQSQNKAAGTDTASPTASEMGPFPTPRVVLAQLSSAAKGGRRYSIGGGIRHSLTEYASSFQSSVSSIAPVSSSTLQFTLPPTPVASPAASHSGSAADSNVSERAALRAFRSIFSLTLRAYHSEISLFLSLFGRVAGTPAHLSAGQVSSSRSVYGGLASSGSAFGGSIYGGLSAIYEALQPSSGQSIYTSRTRGTVGTVGHMTAITGGKNSQMIIKTQNQTALSFEALDSLLRDVSQSVGDLLHPLLRAIDSPALLASCSALLRDEITEELVRPNEPLFASLINAVMNLADDVHERLLFQSQRFIYDVLRKYTPSNRPVTLHFPRLPPTADLPPLRSLALQGDTDYPLRITAYHLLRMYTTTANVVPPSLSASLSPPLETTLTFLTSIQPGLTPDTFGSLVTDALGHYIQAMQSMTRTIRKGSMSRISADSLQQRLTFYLPAPNAPKPYTEFFSLGQVACYLSLPSDFPRSTIDALLFSIRELITLREHLAPFGLALESSSLKLSFAPLLHTIFPFFTSTPVPDPHTQGMVEDNADIPEGFAHPILDSFSTASNYVRPIPEAPSEETSSHLLYRVFKSGLPEIVEEKGDEMHKLYQMLLLACVEFTNLCLDYCGGTLYRNWNSFSKDLQLGESQKHDSANALEAPLPPRNTWPYFESLVSLLPSLCSRFHQTLPPLCRTIALYTGSTASAHTLITPVLAPLTSFLTNTRHHVLRFLEFNEDDSEPLSPSEICLLPESIPSILGYIDAALWMLQATKELGLDPGSREFGKEAWSEKDWKAFFPSGDTRVESLSAPEASNIESMDDAAISDRIVVSTDT